MSTSGHPHSLEAARRQRSAAKRVVFVGAVMMLAVLLIGGQLIRLAIKGQRPNRIAVTAPIAESYARSPIVDRNGNVLALDILLPSIIADPAQIQDLEPTVDALLSVLTELDRDHLQRRLGNLDSRFAWVARKISTARAQQVHDLGLPGISYRWETKRTYPAGIIAGHVLGAVNIDNRGTAGLERFLDDTQGLHRDQADAEADAPGRGPLRTTLLLGVQHALEAELATALQMYAADAAAGIIMDVDTGEVAGAASLPEVDPAFPETWQNSRYQLNQVASATYELGSVFKLINTAMALETGKVNTDTLIAAHRPIRIGKTEISDGNRRRRPLSVGDVFLRSSNVGSGRLALIAGKTQQQRFLSQLKLLAPVDTEAGTIAAPGVPAFWGDVETVTIAYGHGLAVAPLQFAAASATLLNGGYRVTPRFTPYTGPPKTLRPQIISERTSWTLRQLMRANVTERKGSGRRADVPGYNVGGKTGTADQIGASGRYDGVNVVTSFIAAFPINQPRYVTMVTLVHPKPTAASDGERSASRNAAPTTARIIERVAPLLGVLPQY